MSESPALLPFEGWNEKNPNDGKEPLAKYRGYSDYVKQETLAQGRYSDTFSHAPSLTNSPPRH